MSRSAFIILRERTSIWPCVTVNAWPDFETTLKCPVHSKARSVVLRKKVGEANLRFEDAIEENAVDVSCRDPSILLRSSEPT